MSDDLKTTKSINPYSIKCCRINLRLSQDKLGELVGIPKGKYRFNTILRWEKGIRKPSSKYIPKLNELIKSSRKVVL